MKPRGPVAVVLALAIALGEVPALAAAPDVSEARRRFVAAVHSSDQAVALAEASVDDLIKSAGSVLTGDHQRKLESLQKLLKALRDFKAAKTRILAGDLGTHEKVMKAADAYAKEAQILAAVFMITVAVVVAVVSVVAAVSTGGTAVAVVAATTAAAAVAAVAAIVSAIAVLQTSLPEILRALGFREAGDSADRWMKDNPWFGATVAAPSVVAAVLASVASAATSLRAAEAAARDAQAKLQALPKLVRPELTAPKQLNLPPPPATFDGDLGGSFNVRLENGQVARPAGEASLHGTIAITSTSSPSVKLTLDGDATLTAGSGGAWVSLSGHGTARLSGFGGGITILNATVGSQGATTLTLRGGDVSVRGCTHTVQAGSHLHGNQLSLAGSLRCGTWSLVSSTLKLEGSGISGSGTLSAWSRNFSMAYSASGDTLRVRGSISGSDTPWTRVPGVAAEYRIEKPKLGLKLEGPKLSPTFEADGIRVRTTATRPDGSPWSSARLTLQGAVDVPAPPATSVPVPFPDLPTPNDAFKAAREACENAARLIPLNDARNTALQVCRSDHPSPPSVPALPNKLEVPVGEIFR